MIDFQNTPKILYKQWGFSFQSRFSWNICTLTRIKLWEKEIIISIFIVGSSLIMATPRKIYDTVSKTTREAGHTVLRLPPYHCDLNSIELIWWQLKRYVAANNVTFKPDVQKLTERAFKTITAERWRSVCEHVKKIEADYWTRDNLCESEIEKFVVNLEEDSSREEDWPFFVMSFAEIKEKIKKK